MDRQPDLSSRGGNSSRAVSGTRCEAAFRLFGFGRHHLGGHGKPGDHGDQHRGLHGRFRNGVVGEEQGADEGGDQGDGTDDFG